MTNLPFRLFVATSLAAFVFPAQAATLMGMSAQGLYHVELQSPGDLQLNVIESWVVVVQDASGAPVEHAAIAIDGGMPAHGHGLPTAPAVTVELGEGRYQLEGVKFNMMGEWELRIDIESPAGTDQVVITFDL